MVNKFRLVLEGVPYQIERKGDLLLVDGQEFPWSVKGDTVNVGGNAHTVKVQGNSASVDGIAYPIEAQGLEEPKPGKARKVATAAADEAGAITAIMPGLVIKITGCRSARRGTILRISLKTRAYAPRSARAGLCGG